MHIKPAVLPTAGHGEEEDVQRRGRVAFIDDAPQLRTLALELLNAEGFDVLVAELETVSLDDVAAWNPDVIVIDPVGAPDASRPPFSMALAIRDDERLARARLIVLASSWAMWQHEPELRLLGSADVIHKPFSASELLVAIRRLCGIGTGIPASAHQVSDVAESGRLGSVPTTRSGPS